MGERGLTVRERILVHLSAFNRFADEFECPEDMCQSGISAATGKSRAHITLELKRMKDAGLVSEKNAHVKGAKSKRKTYLLTPQGLAMNSEIVSFLNGMTVEMAETDDIRMLSGGKAAEYLNANLGMRWAIAVDTVLGSGGALDIMRLQRSAERPVSDKFRHSINPTDFQPRKELDEIIEILGSEKPNTIALLGIPGMGKTALLAQLARILDTDTKFMYRRMYSFDSPGSVLNGIAEFLDGAGEPELLMSTSKIGTTDISRCRDWLADCFARHRILLVFDEYERAQGAIRPLMAVLMDAILDSGSAMIVASSRRGDFYSLKDIVLDNTVREITLEPLDKEGASKLLNSDSPEDAKRYLELAGGHPLSLKLLAAGMAPANLAGLMDEEVLGKDRELSRICRFAAVLRKPFMPDDLELLGFGNASCIRKDLVFEAQPGSGYLLHPAVSSIMRGITGKHMLKDLHSRAAEFYIQSGSGTHEALYHLIHAERMDRAGELLMERGEELLPTDRGEELVDMIDVMLEWDRVSAEARKKASEIVRLAGRAGPASPIS